MRSHGSSARFSERTHGAECTERSRMDHGVEATGICLAPSRHALFLPHAFHGIEWPREGSRPTRRVATRCKRNATAPLRRSKSNDDRAPTIGHDRRARHARPRVVHAVGLGRKPISARTSYAGSNLGHVIGDRRFFVSLRVFVGQRRSRGFRSGFSPRDPSPSLFALAALAFLTRRAPLGKERGEKDPLPRGRNALLRTSPGFASPSQMPFTRFARFLTPL